MSLNPRRFSLDSSMDEGQLRLSPLRGKWNKKCRASLDEGQLNIQELNSKLMPLREQTIAEQTLERSDGVIKANSFLKHNKTFHKLFPETPQDEKLTHTFTCTIQKEVFYHGKLFVSENYICFYSSVLLKDTKVVIPASSVQEVKKHTSALFMLTLQTTNGEKYSFASLRNRDMCYRILQDLCSNTQGNSTNSSPRLSSTEIELEQDGLPSFSSQEDTVDVSRASSCCLDDGSPLLSRDGHSTISRSRPVHSTDENHSAVWWIWRIIWSVTPVFSLRRWSNVGVVLAIYLVLTALQLLVSGYIGLRIIALEQQLNTLGALTELSLAQSLYSSIELPIKTEPWM